MDEAMALLISEENLNEKTTGMEAAEGILLKAGYNLVQQLASQGSSKLILSKHIPEQLFERYLRAAEKKVVARQLANGTWFAEIEGFSGVWANEEVLPNCLGVLRDVLIDWLLLKIEHEDRDIPVVEGIDLNVI